MLNALRADALRYRKYGGWFRNLGFWVTATHRLGAWARRLPPVVRLPFQILGALLRLPCRLLLHVEIPSRTRIGPGLLLVHPYNIILPGDTVIGAECSIYHEVTLGAGPVPGVPSLGDHVVLFVGSRILGGVVLGDASEVGANAVVTRDVPARSLVLAAASRTVPQALLRKEAAPPGPDPVP